MAENKSVAGAKKSTAKGKKRAKRSVPLGQAHIQATAPGEKVSVNDPKIGSS